MSTLGQLKTDVDEWLARDDIAVSGLSFPSMLRLAEAEIARTIYTTQQETRTTLGPISTRTFPLPADYLDMRNVFRDDPNHRFIEYMTPEAIRESRIWNSGRVTSFYSIEGDGDLTGSGTQVIVLAPEPSASSTLDLEIYYVAKFPALVNDPDTNWLLINYYDAYLWATLMQAAIFIHEDELLGKYGSLYEKTRNAIRIAENRKRYGNGNQKQSYGSPRTVV